LIGVLCCNELADRPVQTVASRFVEPLAHISDVTVVLVPALPNAVDIDDIAPRLDGLLLTGSRSNVAGHRYGARAGDPLRLDEQRDEVALRLADRLIERGKPVFGICRGLQELNVLFGGTLRDLDAGTHGHPAFDQCQFEELFEHMHDIELIAGGLLAPGARHRRISVNSVHLQGIDRLGSGLRVEAVATIDGLVEAFSARPLQGEVLAVQWHPEWNGAQCATSRTFFEIIGNASRGIAPEAVSAIEALAV
jgi:putative glutamine amidotransferase